MPRASLFAVLLFLVGACLPAQNERVRHHTEDGFHLFQRGSYADARDCFQSAIALKPNDPDLIYNLAQCHDRLGHHSQSEALYKECLRHDPDHPEARHAWLLLMLQTDREADGRRMVEEWMRSRPKSGGPFAEDAWLRARAGDVDTARRRYQQALNHDPRNPRALVGLADIYRKLDHPGRALVLYERALEAKPDQPEIAKLVRELRGKGVTGPKPD
jgi:Tfp pilus assembly protein PilF